MTPDVVSRACEPFYTTKASGKGTGLGLSTIFGIAIQNGGTLHIDSTPGKGTRVDVLVPATTLSGSLFPDTNRKPASQQKGSETLLFVDDEPAILRVGKNILERQGYQVLATSDPKEALAWCEQYGKTIHLLISDVIMPDFNGKDLSQQIRSRIPDIKILFISGYPAETLQDYEFLDSQVHYLSKPFTTNSLTYKIREILDQKQ